MWKRKLHLKNKRLTCIKCLYSYSRAHLWEFSGLWLQQQPETSVLWTYHNGCGYSCPHAYRGIYGLDGGCQMYQTHTTRWHLQSVTLKTASIFRRSCIWHSLRNLQPEASKLQKAEALTHAETGGSGHKSFCVAKVTSLLRIDLFP